MHFFENLGTSILQRWHANDFDERAFPDVACACLAEQTPSDHVDPLDVVRWVHASQELPSQADVPSLFGNPSITVFRAQRFYIDVLFWVDGTTSIHQHGFTGAFHVMAGASLHSQFSFTDEKRYSDRLKSGELRLEGTELLTRGAVRPIRAGNRTIHSLFHLERPSVSVVVRTVDDPFAGPQYSYARPSLAYDPFFTTEALEKKLQTLDLLQKIGAPTFEEDARELVRSLDSFSAFRALERLAERIRPFEAYARFLASVLPAHAHLVERMIDVQEEQKRQSNIIARRERIRAPEHRLFLAILLNVTSRDAILATVHAAVPDTPPVETIARWVAELAATRIEKEARLSAGEAENALGIALDESGLAIFRALLGGASDDDVLARLREEYDAEDVAAQRDGVLELCRAFRGSLLFGNLLGG